MLVGQVQLGVLKVYWCICRGHIHRRHRHHRFLPRAAVEEGVWIGLVPSGQLLEEAAVEEEEEAQKG